MESFTVSGAAVDKATMSEKPEDYCGRGWPSTQQRWRKDASSQVEAHSTGPNHTSKSDEAEILVRADNRVSRELLQSWVSGPQSIKKCNDLPSPHLAPRLCLDKVINREDSTQMTSVPGVNISEPNCPRAHTDGEIRPSATRLRAMGVGINNLDRHTKAYQRHGNCMLQHLTNRAVMISGSANCDRNVAA
ncbi:hypothetical protein SprV_0401638900 [Sparganum proliferum]